MQLSSMLRTTLMFTMVFMVFIGSEIISDPPKGKGKNVRFSEQESYPEEERIGDIRLTIKRQLDALDDELDDELEKEKIDVDSLVNIIVATAQINSRKESAADDIWIDAFKQTKKVLRKLKSKALRKKFVIKLTQIYVFSMSGMKKAPKKAEEWFEVLAPDEDMVVQALLDTQEESKEYAQQIATAVLFMYDNLDERRLAADVVARMLPQLQSKVQELVKNTLKIDFSKFAEHRYRDSILEALGVDPSSIKVVKKNVDSAVKKARHGIRKALNGLVIDLTLQDMTPEQINAIKTDIIKNIG